MHNKKNGFTFFEVIIALLVLAIIGGVIVPRLRHNNPAADVQIFSSNLNSLIFKAANLALISRSVYKVVFDFKKRISWLEKCVVDKKSDKNIKSENIFWPENIDIVEFYINGTDECKKYYNAGGIETTWIYIVPDGMVQPAIINLFDRSEEKEDKKFSMVLNPFSLQFKVYDEFKMP